MATLGTAQGAGPEYAAGARALIIADSAAMAHDAAEASRLAGCPARASLNFAQALADPGDFPGASLILLETADASASLVGGILARVGALAREPALGVVATVLPDQIDLAAAQLFGPRVQLLCAPSQAERVAAIAEVRWHGRAVADENREGEAARLRRLNEEVARIAETLARLARGEDAEPRAAVRDPIKGYRGPEGPAPAETGPAEVRAAIRARRMRAQFFADELFADPAWDMLLDLFAAGLEGRQVSVSSLCIAAAVPPTTALRWISTLHEAGLFERQADPADRRRAYIGLSAKGLDGMRSYANAVRRAGLHLV